MSDPNDREFEDFLAGRDKVSKAYREATRSTQAPEELDAAILAAARQAASRPKAARRPRWIRPMALAATLILSLSVLVNIWRDPVSRELASPAMDTAVFPPELGEPATAPSEPLPSARDSGNLSSTQLEARSKAKAQISESASGAAEQAISETQEQPIQQGHPKPESDPSKKSVPSKPVPAAQATERNAARVAPESKTEVVAPAPPIAGAATMMSDDIRVDEPETQANVIQEREKAASKAEHQERRSQSQEHQKLSRIAAPVQRKEQVVGQEKLSQMDGTTDAYSGARASAAEADQSIAAADDAGDRRALFQSEVEKVRGLIKADERDEARRVLSNLREAYPDQSLPKDLQLFLDQQ
tara:strand:- start:55128 stop:56198 length:1071 start_codon:yes stop_codon:yes gene_type:complete